MNSTDKRPTLEAERNPARRSTALTVVVALVGLASVIYAVTMADRGSEATSERERSGPMSQWNQTSKEKTETERLAAAPDSPFETATFALG